MMGFCELEANDPGLVVATYTLAVLPWSVITFMDPISTQWDLFWWAFLKSFLYFFFSIIPYFLLVPYAVLQACSEEEDIKEFMTALVAMLASLWNLHRSLRGFLALLDVYLLWEGVDVALLHRGFYYDLMPVSPQWKEEKQKEDVSLQETQDLKCSAWNLLVSSAVVDNDWPRDAPRLRYLEALWNLLEGCCLKALSKSVTSRAQQNAAQDEPSQGLERGENVHTNQRDERTQLGFWADLSEFLRASFRENFREKVHPSDAEDRETMVTVWLLWMIRRSVILMTEGLKERYDLQKYSWDEEKVRPFLRGGERPKWLHHWICKKDHGKKRRQKRRMHQDNELLLEILIKKALFNLGRIENPLSRANLDAQKSEISSRLSFLPNKVEQVLSLPETELLVLAKEYLNLKNGNRSVGEVMRDGLFSSEPLPPYSEDFSRWLKSPIHSEPDEHVSNNYPHNEGKALAFIAIIEQFADNTFSCLDPETGFYFGFYSDAALLAGLLGSLIRLTDRLSRDEGDTLIEFLRGKIRERASLKNGKEKTALAWELFRSISREKNTISSNSKLTHAVLESLKSLLNILEERKTKRMSTRHGECTLEVWPSQFYTRFLTSLESSGSADPREETLPIFLGFSRRISRSSVQFQMLEILSHSRAVLPFLRGFLLYNRILIERSARTFRNISKGEYAACFSFRWKKEQSKEREFPESWKSICLYICVTDYDNSPKLMIEPIFPFLSFVEDKMGSKFNTAWFECSSIPVSSNNMNIHMLLQTPRVPEVRELSRSILLSCCE